MFGFEYKTSREVFHLHVMAAYFNSLLKSLPCIEIFVIEICGVSETVCMFWE